jgi:putative transposase
VLVHSASILDREGGQLLLEKGVAKQFPRIRHLWVDLGYRGRFVTWVKATLKWSVIAV